MKSIAFIGNVTSKSFLIGRELIRKGYDIEIIGKGNIFQTNTLHGEPVRQEKPGILHRAIHKYSKRLYHATINTKDYDIELRSFSDPIVKAKHRAVIYHGSDLRNNLWPVTYPCFYSTVELGQLYLDPDKIKGGQAVWLPRCFVADYFGPEPRMPFDGKHLIVGHFPTDPKMEEKGMQNKGSRSLYRALDILKQRGYDIELLTPETIGHVKHEEMPALYKRCHVIADQFMVGQHGVIALEAIMMNRPVVCHIPEKHWEYEEMKSQIVNCTQEPESIADALLKAVDHKVDPAIVERLYNPKKSTEILENALQSWGFLN